MRNESRRKQARNISARQAATGAVIDFGFLLFRDRARAQYGYTSSGHANTLRGGEPLLCIARDNLVFISRATLYIHTTGRLIRKSRSIL